MNTENNQVEKDQPELSSQAVDKSRRSFARLGVAAPVIMTLANRPAWASGVDKGCQGWSGFQSYNKAVKAGHQLSGHTGTINPPHNPPNHYCGTGTVNNWKTVKNCLPYSNFHENGTPCEGGTGCLRNRNGSDAKPTLGKYSSSGPYAQQFKKGQGHWTAPTAWVGIQNGYYQQDCINVGQNDAVVAHKLESSSSHITSGHVFKAVSGGDTLSDCILHLNNNTYTRLNCMAWFYVNACDGNNFFGSTPEAVVSHHNDPSIPDADIIAFCSHLIQQCS